jgi:hypothetical protein
VTAATRPPITTEQTPIAVKTVAGFGCEPRRGAGGDVALNFCAGGLLGPAGWSAEAVTPGGR